MEEGGRRILVVGQSSALLDGVSDLLQLVGYQVDLVSGGVEGDGYRLALAKALPNLMIVDLSESAADAYRLSERIRSVPDWSAVPLLYVSFSGDDRIREIQRFSRNRQGGPTHFYAHTVLSIDGLLDKVQACLI